MCICSGVLWCGCEWMCLSTIIYVDIYILIFNLSINTLMRNELKPKHTLFTIGDDNHNNNNNNDNSEFLLGAIIHRPDAPQ